MAQQGFLHLWDNVEHDPQFLDDLLGNLIVKFQAFEFLGNLYQVFLKILLNAYVGIYCDGFIQCAKIIEEEFLKVLSLIRK